MILAPKGQYFSFYPKINVISDGYNIFANLVLNLLKNNLLGGVTVYIMSSAAEIMCKENRGVL